MEYNIAEELKDIEEEIDREMGKLSGDERVLFKLLNKKINLLLREIEWLEDLVMGKEG